MEAIVNAAWEDRSQLQNEETKQTIEAVIEAIDNGELRTAEPTDDGWKVNDWVKKR